jgi:hypothetical protein
MLSPWVEDAAGIERQRDGFHGWSIVLMARGDLHSNLFYGQNVVFITTFSLE